MKIFRIIATDGPSIKSKYFLAKNAKKANEMAYQCCFSRFLLDTVQIENANGFWNFLSEAEQEQFKQALINNFFKEEVL